MNTEQLKQINTHLALIEAELGRIRVAIREASVPIPDGIIGNSSDSPYVKSDSHDPNHYMPKVGEVVLVATRSKNFVTRVFTQYDPSSNFPFMTVVNGLADSECKNYRMGLKYSETEWLFCRRLNGEIIEFGCDKPKQEVPPTPNADNFEYIDLLPEGYEFCAESEAEKWVKVENNILTGYSVGEILLGNPMGELRKNSRPIRKIPTNVKQSEHECKYCGAMTSQPDEQCYKNPYAVDWTNAPDWADVHAFNFEGIGKWGGLKGYGNDWYPEALNSPFTLPAGLDWKLSKTYRPQ